MIKTNNRPLKYLIRSYLICKRETFLKLRNQVFLVDFLNKINKNSKKINQQVCLEIYSSLLKYNNQIKILNKQSNQNYLQIL
jgi:hypothetical protein